LALYNLQEGALYFGRTVGAVREMLWAGKMPYVKDSKQILTYKIWIHGLIEARLNQFIKKLSPLIHKEVRKKDSVAHPPKSLLVN